MNNYELITYFIIYMLCMRRFFKFVFSSILNFDVRVHHKDAKNSLLSGRTFNFLPFGTQRKPYFRTFFVFESLHCLWLCENITLIAVGYWFIVVGTLSIYYT